MVSSNRVYKASKVCYNRWRIISRAVRRRVERAAWTPTTRPVLVISSGACFLMYTMSPSGTYDQFVHGSVRQALSVCVHTCPPNKSTAPAEIVSIHSRSRNVRDYKVVISIGREKLAEQLLHCVSVTICESEQASAHANKSPVFSIGVCRELIFYGS